ncbi:uncharacterized protein [Tiliqua scincoides]|uniref:uncharacterized protein n=1 Tax=Tiliqua scincoides TaxID=71010 RepID=UPI0034624458
MQGQYVTITIPGIQYLTVCEVQVFGERIGPSGNNVAREGKAFQSTTYNELGEAENALDGSSSTNYLRGHCTHTQQEDNPWWTVDLRAEFRIYRVSVTNRGDCCDERLNGAEIRVGNSFESGGITNPRCATISSLGPGETGSFNCEGMQGQYVTVTIPGVQYLTVCEVQVFGERIGPSGHNVALEGRAFQSSTYNELGGPENALDGSASTNYLRGHCTHTQQEDNPWWTVDLRAEFRISRVSVTNRGDCCEERLDGAEIRIGNLQEKGGITNPRCATISSLGAGETGSFNCEGMQGQYVTITIPGIQYLTVCEVQVFGERIEPSGDLNITDGTETSAIERWVKQTKPDRQPLDNKAVGQTDSKGVPNVAIGGKASQSSTFNKLGLARNAIDGSIAGEFMRGSCIHTDFQHNPWWIVDLKAVYNVSSVRVSNREDCCASRINGAEIRVGNSFESGGTTNPRCATIISLGPGETGSFDCGGMVGQYVTVSIPGVQYLTVCEVQVFGVMIGASDHDVAREGRAFQSTTYNALGEPENALDGSPSTNYLRGHCTHTQQEDNPWWTVDLRAEFRISRVSVTNRGDCCAQRLNGAEIRVGNLPEKGGITNPRYCNKLRCHKVYGIKKSGPLVAILNQPSDMAVVICSYTWLCRCAMISSLGPGQTGSFNCEGMQGRFVTVTIPGIQYLTVCEVQVFGERIEPSVPNVAIGGKAFQSSTFNKLGLARNAIDGSISGDFLHGSCIHTDFQRNPWWTVDLKAVYNVSSVRVSNREDCCEERIDGAEIRVGNSFRSGGTTNPRCATISSLGPGETGSFDCGGMLGQYVTVTIPGEGFLTLCEVQVFGVKTGVSA